MKVLVLSFGKILFQLSVVIFIIGYCFGFWFKGNKQKLKKTQPVKLLKHPSQLQDTDGAKAA